MKLIKNSLSLIAAVTLMTTSMAPAYAKPSEHQDLVEELENAGVAPEQIDSLIQKIDSNQTLDSHHPDVDPIEIDEYEENGFDVTRFEYPDGSYVIAEVEQPTQHLNEDDISVNQTGCTSSSSGGWQIRRNCIVAWASPAFNFSHRMDARWTTGSAGVGQIDSVWGASASGLIDPGTASVSIIRSSGTISSPAISQGRVSGGASGGGQDFVLETQVSPNGINPQPIQ